MNLYIKRQNFLFQKSVIRTGILIFLILFLNIFQGQIKNSFYFVSFPLAESFRQAGNKTSDFFNSFWSFKNLQQKNDQLIQENQQLLSKISLLQSNLIENQAKKEALQNTQKDNFKIVSAQVAGLNDDFILLNKGSDDGISENMPVISSQKVLYGKIFKVYKKFSQAILISNKNSTVDVKVQNDDPSKNPVHGAIKGSGNLSLYLDLVNSDVEIKQNDILITSGLEGVFPSNLLVGKIDSVSKNDLKPFQTATIQPFFDPKNTDNLFIITNYLK